METKLRFIKTLTSEVLRHEFCRSFGGCDAIGKREAEKMNAVDKEEDDVPQDKPFRRRAASEAGVGIAEESSKDKPASGCRDTIHGSMCSKKHVGCFWLTKKSFFYSMDVII